MPVDIPSLQVFYRWLSGAIVENVIARVTSDVVLDPFDIAAEHSREISHLVMLECIDLIQSGTVQVMPVLAQAKQRYETAESNEWLEPLLQAKSRPILLTSTACTLVINGLYHEMPLATAQDALAYYDIVHPWDDIVAGLLPEIPPDLSTQDKLYQFIGKHMSNALMAARAALIRNACATLLKTPVAA